MVKNINRKKLLAVLGALLAAAIIITAAVKTVSALTSHIRLYTLEEADVEQDVELVAHRGMSALAPENTLEAARAAGENGYKAVEFDVRRTADGVWVVMHDSDIERMTNGRGEISELTYKQLLAYSFDEGNNVNKYDLIVIPTLNEMLSVCSRYSMTPVIEIKHPGTDCVEDLLNTVGYSFNSECKIISFDREQLLTAKKLLNAGTVSLRSTSTSLWWLTSDLSGDTLELAKQNPEITVSFNCEKTGSADEIKAFTAAGVGLEAWNADKPERVQELYALGIIAFTTNSLTYTAVKEESVTW